MNIVRFGGIAGALICASTAVTAQTLPPMSAFYASCLASGGSPYTYSGGGATDLLEVGKLLAVQSYSLTISPVSSTNFIIEVTRKSGAATLPTMRAATGQSLVFSASEFALRNVSIRVGEYCLRRID